MTGDWRGVLYPARLPSFHRLPAPERVAALVGWFWIPEWDIAPGRVSRQQVISFPACNLVVERRFVGLAGPTTRASHRDLTGRGWAVGALLRPAAVRAFVDDPAELLDDYRPLDPDGPLGLEALRTAVTTAMGSTEAPEARREHAVEAFADWLATRVPEPTAEALQANAMAELITTDPSVLRVEDAARRLAVSVRTLQRLARRYVGLPPAAMIRRRRLQEAAERLRQRPDTDIAAIAAELGYADHAHLTGDFRTVLGSTPSGYRAHAGGA